MKKSLNIISYVMAIFIITFLLSLCFSTSASATHDVYEEKVIIGISLENKYIAYIQKFGECREKVEASLVIVDFKGKEIKDLPNYKPNSIFKKHLDDFKITKDVLIKYKKSIRNILSLNKSKLYMKSYKGGTITKVFYKSRSGKKSVIHKIVEEKHPIFGVSTIILKAAYKIKDSNLVIIIITEIGNRGGTTTYDTIKVFEVPQE